MKLITHSEWSLNPEQLKDALIYLMAQHLAGEITQQTYIDLYGKLITRMDTEGIEVIVWNP